MPQNDWGTPSGLSLYDHWEFEKTKIVIFDSVEQGKTREIIYETISFFIIPFFRKKEKKILHLKKLWRKPNSFGKKLCRVLELQNYRIIQAVIFHGKGSLEDLILHSVYFHLQNLQGWGLYHDPGEVALVIHCSQCKKFLSCIEMKPPLKQLLPVGPCLIHMWSENFCLLYSHPLSTEAL